MLTDHLRGNRTDAPLRYPADGRDQLKDLLRIEIQSAHDSLRNSIKDNSVCDSNLLPSRRKIQK
jgi:hypothetical protein